MYIMMNQTTSRIAARPITLLRLPPTLGPILPRFYATQQPSENAAQTPASKRRAVTPFNDTGFVPWKELSGAEKAARATQQSFNFGLVIVGLVLTVRTPDEIHSLM